MTDTWMDEKGEEGRNDRVDGTSTLVHKPTVSGTNVHPPLYSKYTCSRTTKF